MRTQSEMLQDIVRKYRTANQPWPATTRDMAQWAIENKLWAPKPSAIVDQCADQLSRAMREEYITDAQGRRVRAKHAAAQPGTGGEQMVLWADFELRHIGTWRWLFSSAGIRLSATVGNSRWT